MAGPYIIITNKNMQYRWTYYRPGKRVVLCGVQGYRSYLAALEDVKELFGNSTEIRFEQR